MMFQMIKRGENDDEPDEDDPKLKKDDKAVVPGPSNFI